MRTEPLTAVQEAALIAILSQWSTRIERVDLYGSRARGSHRPGSDVDLMLHGRLSDDDMLAMAVRLDESDLSLSVDLKRSVDITDAQLRRAIERDAMPLFTGAQLRAAAGADSH